MARRGAPFLLTGGFTEKTCQVFTRPAKGILGNQIFWGICRDVVRTTGVWHGMQGKHNTLHA